MCTSALFLERVQGKLQERARAIMDRRLELEALFRRAIANPLLHRI